MNDDKKKKEGDEFPEDVGDLGPFDPSDRHPDDELMRLEIVGQGKRIAELERRQIEVETHVAALGRQIRKLVAWIKRGFQGESKEEP